MNLFEKINEDIKNAMKAKETEKLNSLRAIKSELLLIKTSGQGEDIDDNVAIEMLQKMIKQRKQAAEIFQQQGRDDLYQKEMNEVSFILPYLPAQMSEEEITTIISQIITNVGANNIKDMGKVMGLASAQLKGKAESKTIAEIVKKLLSL